MIRIARCFSRHNAMVRSALGSVRHVARQAACPRSPKHILRGTGLFGGALHAFVVREWIEVSPSCLEYLSYK